MTLDLDAIEAEINSEIKWYLNCPPYTPYQGDVADVLCDLRLILQLCAELRSSRSDCERLRDEVRATRQYFETEQTRANVYEGSVIRLELELRRAREIIEKKDEALKFYASDTDDQYTEVMHFCENQMERKLIDEGQLAREALALTLDVSTKPDSIDTSSKPRYPGHQLEFRAKAGIHDDADEELK